MQVHGQKILLIDISFNLKGSLTATTENSLNKIIESKGVC